VDLTLTTREAEGRAIVAVGGEIDVYTAPRLRDRITELVGEGRYHIVIDLEAVEFLDSTGLGVLVGGLKKVRAHDGSPGEGLRHPRLRAVPHLLTHGRRRGASARLFVGRVTRRRVRRLTPA
jgi:anti-anti-sigma factor